MIQNGAVTRMNSQWGFVEITKYKTKLTLHKILQNNGIKF